MDSQLASVLTSGSLGVQNGSRCAEGSGPVTEGFLEAEEEGSVSSGAGNLRPCPVRAAVTIITQDAPSVNGNRPAEGGNPQPASQETSKIGGFRQPITVKTGVPVLRSQPIRIKIVVPPRRKRPIANSAISLTKDFALAHFRRHVLLPAGAELTDRNKSKIIISAVKNEGVHRKSEEPAAESFHGTGAERGQQTGREPEGFDVKIIHTNGSETAFISRAKTINPQNQMGIKEETTEGEIEKNSPAILREVDSCEMSDAVRTEEQTAPLDLSLPKNRESPERSLLEDSGCETSLIMEVDEYEGDGDRDVVEEDDVGEEDRALLMDGPDTFGDSVLSPSFFATSVFSSLPSIDDDDHGDGGGGDTENLLLIDDQGIPYTLSPGGVKVPQVGASTSRDPPPDPADSAQVEGTGSPPLAEVTDNALSAPSDSHTAPAPDVDSPSQAVDYTKAPEVLTSLIVSSVASKATDPNVKSVQEAHAVLAPPTGVSAPGQPIQILTNPSSNAPILLLSSSSSSPSSTPLSSAPLGLSLPLSVSQTTLGTAAPMFLLLSSVPSSLGNSALSSTPIAVLDPSTGQLSQITAASSARAGAPGPPLPALAHPVLRLSDPPVVLSGVNNVNSGSALPSLTVSSSAPAVQVDHQSTTPLPHPQISSSNSNPGSEAISAGGVSNEKNKPSTFSESSPRPQPSNSSCDPLTQPSSEADAQSPASESNFDPCDVRTEHLPLDDHLYFSHMAPSPPIGPLLPSAQLDPLDPLSPEGSPNSMGARRVLYCQLCPRVFFYLSDLERHAITHSQKKPHVCQQCGKAFKRSSHLQRHKHIHTGQRNFVCPICAKRFREAGELQRHQRVHTGEKPYQCQLCHTRFAERNTLRRHTKRKHPYHQVAMEMLNERRDRGGSGDGVSGAQEDEESAEWYSSTVSNLDNSDSEMET